MAGDDPVRILRQPQQGKIEGGKMLMEDMKKFCVQIQTILERQKFQIESGRLFNFFDALSLQEKELIHSRVIVTLLSPQGRHGLGTNPLRCFVRRLKEWGFDRLGCKCGLDAVCVYREYYIGAIDANYENGGSIDILINDGKFCIAIENKINAGDQQKQLFRYAKWLKAWRSAQPDRECLLIYLTPHGHLPSEDSTNKAVLRLNNRSELSQQGLRYLPLSYEFISRWLDDVICECYHDMTQKVEIFLKQYKEVVDGMNIDVEDEKVIECLLQGNLGVAEAMVRVYETAKNKALQNALKNAMPQDLCCDAIKAFNSSINNDQNPLVLQQINDDLSLAIAFYNCRINVGVSSRSEHGSAVAEFRNLVAGFNTSWKNEPSDWWPICFVSPEITGSFLDSQEDVKKFSDDIRGIVDFIRCQAKTL